MKTIFGIKGFALTEYAISANAILGIRDSGKTYTATAAAEQLFDAGVPFVTFDPIGVWRWMRVPGQSKGYPVVVAGGRAGDLPLTTKNAGAILRAAMESGVSLVIDLFTMDLSKSDWRKIVRECVEILLHENADFGLRHVFIEEAAEFVPQRPMDMLVYSAVEKLVRMGGNSKLGCTLINQRSADLNKSVLELCANVFVHRQKGKNTLLDLKKWFTLLDLSDAEEREIAESLPGLKSGQCWALLNDVPKPVLLKVPQKNSLHPDRRAATATPAEIAKRQPVPADKFVALMKTKLAEKVPAPKAPLIRSDKPAVAQQSDKDFFAHLRQAREIALGEARETALAAIAEAREATRSQIDSVAAQIAASLSKACLSQFDALERRIRAKGPTKTVRKEPWVVKSVVPATGMAVTEIGVYDAPKIERQRPQHNGGGDESVSGPQSALLGALAWWAKNGHDAPTRAQIAGYLGWRVTSGHLKNVSGAAKSAGLVDYPSQGTISLTEQGRRHAPEVDDSVPLIQRVRSSLNGPQQQVFDVLFEGTRQAPMSRQAITDALGWNIGSGHIKNVLGSMRSLEIVSYPTPGEVDLQGWVTE